MKRAGCYNLAFGLETADDDMLRRIKKQNRVRDAVDAVRMSKQAGITVGIFCLFFLPGETRETIAKMFSLIRRLKPLWTGANVATLIPGTELYRIGLSEGKIKGDLTRVMKECKDMAGTAGNNFSKEEVTLMYRKIRKQLSVINLTSHPIERFRFLLKSASRPKQFARFVRENRKYLLGR